MSNHSEVPCEHERMNASRHTERGHLLWRAFAIAFVGLLCASIVPSSARATEYDATIEKSISASDYWGYAGPWTLDDGQTVTVDLVVSGSEIGLYFITDDQLNAWDQSDIVPIPISALSDDSCLSMHASWTVATSDTYYYVFYNPHYTTATIRGSVVATNPSSTNWTLIGGIGAAIVAVIVVVVVLMLLRKPKPAAPPPYMGAQAMYVPPPVQASYPQYAPPVQQAPYPQYAPPVQPAQAPPPQQAQPMSGARLCRSCGRTIDVPGMIFCPHCGNRMG